MTFEDKETEERMKQVYQTVEKYLENIGGEK